MSAGFLFLTSSPGSFNIGWQQAFYNFQNRFCIAFPNVGMWPHGNNQYLFFVGWAGCRCRFAFV